MGDWRLRLLTLVGVLLLAACGADVSDIEASTQRDVQAYMRSDSKLAPYRLEVTGVDLVHATGNEYTGFVTVRTRSYVEHRVPIHVVWDDGEGLWQIERGGFLFLMDEPGPRTSP